MLVRVGARQVEQQAGRRGAVALPELGQRGVERVEVGLVAATVGQVDGEIAALLVEREVEGTVQRQREHGGIVTEDGRSAVALVDVEVDHRHPQ